MNDIFIYLKNDYQFRDDNDSKVKQVIKSCLKRGFTEDQTIRYTALTEHIQPDLNDEYAVNEMHKIANEDKSDKTI